MQSAEPANHLKKILGPAHPRNLHCPPYYLQGSNLWKHNVLMPLQTKLAEKIPALGLDGTTVSLSILVNQDRSRKIGKIRNQIMVFE